MLVHIDIPVFRGGAIDVFWEDNAKISIIISNSAVEIAANKEAFFSLAKQLLYFSCNNFLAYSHVHYDGFFCKGNYQGPELIIEFSPSEEPIMIDKCEGESVTVSLDLSNDGNDIQWDNRQHICVKHHNNSVLIKGDEKAFLSLAQCLLAFAIVGRKQCMILDDSVCQWGEQPLLLRLQK